ncbi:hypothetical protein Mgra_00006474 [Meloidogyne graminicola]|uniref:Uncharacterized protein n=1 Tax=Meloidogyne graminicola TaxID=189291 RepID=A0A8S9ZL35_9BILA|nr:hypothetical protein Mgra_00006474 [Meloidogyne graminicola]
MSAESKIVYKYTPRLYRLLDHAVAFRQTKYATPILYGSAGILSAFTAVICFKVFLKINIPFSFQNPFTISLYIYQAFNFLKN